MGELKGLRVNCQPTTKRCLGLLLASDAFGVIAIFELLSLFLSQGSGTGSPLPPSC